MSDGGAVADGVAGGGVDGGEGGESGQGGDAGGDGGEGGAGGGGGLPLVASISTRPAVSLPLHQSSTFESACTRKVYAPETGGRNQPLMRTPRPTAAEPS